MTIVAATCPPLTVFFPGTSPPLRGHCIMRFKSLLLLPLLGAALLADGISIKSLSMPMFDETGLLTKTLKAESAEGPLTRPVLKSGVITFHTATGDKIAPGSTLTFAEAIYDKIEGIVEGDGPVRFASSASDLSGVGFRHELQTGRLKLHHDVLLEIKSEEYKGVNVRGEKADALIQQNPSDRTWVIAEALITGPVVATDVLIDKVRFDKVETDHATYSRADGTVTFASPVTGWRNGEKTVMGGKLIQFQLKTAPVAEPAAAEPSSP